MCGICGVVEIAGSAREPIGHGVLDRMTDVMAHRGPDDRGTIVRPGVALGARRLSVIDLEGGHQPFTNEDGSVIGLQNGELYNHAEIRRALAADGHRFRSKCDTEILPHLYERDGVAFVPALRGMFGLAVHDIVERRTIVARDRLGIKPMYYAVAGDLLVFGSELKSVLASGLVDSELDLEAIDAYLSLGFVPAPRTPLAQVRKLLPGEQLVVEDGRLRLERYWRVPAPPAEPPARSDFEWREELLSALDEAVRIRLMADVPLGAMLSGGLDSTLIVALMARAMSRPVKTFSIGFLEAGAENELGAARAVAEHFGTDHHELELSFARQDVDLVDLVWHMDEPVADLSALGFLALSQLAAADVTVALSGQGADELFGGYSRHRNAALAAAFLQLPKPLRLPALAAVRNAPRRFAAAGETIGAPDAVARQLVAFGQIRRDLAPALAGGPLAALDGASARAAVVARAGGAPSADPLAAMLQVDLQLGLPDDMLHYFDRTSMAWSLEVRVPFLDHHVVELATRIPSRLKVDRLRTKQILRSAAEGLVPPDVIERRKVGFFNAAVASWFRGQSRESVATYLLAERPAYGELLDRHEVAQLVRRHEEGGAGGRGLLALLMLEIWLAEYLPRATETGAGAAAAGKAA